MIREAIQKLVDHTDLTDQEAHMAMCEIMSGTATTSQIGAFLTALRIKGETVEEISAFASTLRGFSCRINPTYNGKLLDTAGTGGDRLKTFNVSTAAAFVIAGVGVRIAKHGNRSVSSQCGSADVLERLGLNLNASPDLIKKSIESVGVGFMYAPLFNPAAKNAIGPRREIGIRTVFNILGPLTNPANADVQLLGVYDPSLTNVLASVLGKLGCKEAMVVHGLEGLDEISTSGVTKIAWLKNGLVNTIEVRPGDFGLETHSLNDVQGHTVEENAKILLRVLVGQSTDKAKIDMVLANAAAGIVLSGRAETFPEGVELARESIENGKAYEKLEETIRLTGGSLQRFEKL
jgi:anthranilate phosphoribosyltransferase